MPKSQNSANSAYSKLEKIRFSDAEIIEPVLLLLILRQHHNRTLIHKKSPHFESEKHLSHPSQSETPLTQPPEKIHNFLPWLQDSISKIQDCTPELKKHLHIALQKLDTLLRSNTPSSILMHELCLELFSSFEEDETEESLGDLTESLLFLFAERSASSAGHSYTPRGIIDLLLKLVDPKPNESIYDPACGSAGFLVAAHQHIKELNSESHLKLYGREIFPATAFAGKVNMLTHNLNEGDISVENCLSTSLETFPHKFDIVITNPPFSLSWEPHESHEYLTYGIPPKNNADYAFIQHSLFKIRENGRGAIITPPGVLFREGIEKEIRKRMIADNKIEAIISIPPSSFYGTTIPTNIILLRQTRKNSNITFINASVFFKKDRSLNRIDKDSIGKLLEIYESKADIPYISRQVSTEEIESNDYNLTVSRYIHNEPPEDETSLELLITQQIDARNKLDALNSKMLDLLSEIKSDKKLD